MNLMCTLVRCVPERTPTSTSAADRLTAMCDMKRETPGKLLLVKSPPL